MWLFLWVTLKLTNPSIHIINKDTYLEEAKYDFLREKYLDQLPGSDWLPLVYSHHSKQNVPLTMSTDSHHSMAQNPPLACQLTEIQSIVLPMVHKALQTLDPISYLRCSPSVRSNHASFLSFLELTSDISISALHLLPLPSDTRMALYLLP